MTHILITGINGFIGGTLCTKMLGKERQVHGTLRSLKKTTVLPDEVDVVQIESISPDTNWSTALNGVDTVVHLAARVHVMKEPDPDPIVAFRLINVAGTEHLAKMSAKAGVRRFVFLSSVGVNGDSTGNRPFTEEDDPNPHNYYSLSKSEAEKILKEIAAESGMEVVIIRAPLVYGPSNPGNFLRLLNLVGKGLPLPLASVNNRRSLIYLGNLVDAIITCVEHPKAAGQTYIVSDGEDVSTPELIRRVAEALGKPARLFPFPPSLMRFAGKFIGKSEAVERLLGSLVVDSSKITRELGWTPPYTMKQGLKETGEWFKRQVKGKAGYR